MTRMPISACCREPVGSRDSFWIEWCCRCLRDTLRPSVTISAARLPEFHGDPAARLIYATARERDVSLVSKDATILKDACRRGDVDVIW